MNQSHDLYAHLKNRRNSIYSYRVYSQPVDKQNNLKISARKKELSQIPSKEPRNLLYLYTPLNRTFVYQKPKRKHDALVLQSDYNKLNTNPANAKWAEKHFSCFQKYHPRSKSIQADYKKDELPLIKPNFIKTCEISLQTYN